MEIYKACCLGFQKSRDPQVSLASWSLGSVCMWVELEAGRIRGASGCPWRRACRGPGSFSPQRPDGAQHPGAPDSQGPESLAWARFWRCGGCGLSGGRLCWLAFPVGPLGVHPGRDTPMVFTAELSLLEHSSYWATGGADLASVSSQFTRSVQLCKS